MEGTAVEWHLCDAFSFEQYMCAYLQDAQADQRGLHIIEDVDKTLCDL